MSDADATRQVEQRARQLAAGEAVDDWIVGRPLSSGGFGTVYQAHHRTSGRAAALKLLHAHLVKSANTLARFEREIRIIEQLRHPNIVELLGAGFSARGQPYLCMELLPGENLGQYIATHAPLSPDSALAILDPLCDALATAHERSIVHRDVKASNVMICGPGIGRVVLLDFGIAKLSDALAPELTASNQALGTPSCMAPEQARGAKVDARADIYGLGVLLFQMITGRWPFHDSSTTMIQYLHQHARRPRASALVPVSERLDDVIACAMAIDPAERFDNTRALHAAASAALREVPAPAVLEDVPAAAVLVAVAGRPADLDEPLLLDLEAVLPAAERFLASLGFAVGLDAGSCAIFVRPHATAADARAAADALWRELSRRPHRHPRVRVGLCARHGTVALAGNDIHSDALLRPAAWDMPEGHDGVWTSAA